MKKTFFEKSVIEKPIKFSLSRNENGSVDVEISGSVSDIVTYLFLPYLTSGSRAVETKPYVATLLKVVELAGYIVKNDKETQAKMRCND